MELPSVGVERVPVRRRNKVRIVDQKLIGIGRLQMMVRGWGGSGIYVLTVHAHAFESFACTHWQ